MRDCLQSQVNRLKFEINNDSFFKRNEKRQLVNAIQEINGLVTGRLDRLDQAARELLQIVSFRAISVSYFKITTLQELAWVAKNEAESIKRLSWITVSTDMVIARHGIIIILALTLSLLPLVHFSSSHVCVSMCRNKSLIKAEFGQP